MSCRIAILDPEVAAKIAAGEVIERPASVVRELVDNALDAGARRVSVEIEGGGAKQIRVTDDGCGMSGEEVELSLARHATSKLRRASDLDRIRTIGFRGEGLPSIAAVSRLTLHSRMAEAEVGWRVRAAGGVMVERSPMARRPGTTVVVDDLFYNTPGRGKFLKSTAAEAAHVTDVVSRLACVAVGVRFELTHNGRSVLALDAVPTRTERVRALLGRRADQLYCAAVQRGDVAVEVCLSRGEAAMSTARQLTLVVNNRPVYDRPLLQAVTGGYGDLLAPGRFPMGAIYVEVDPQVVDVNIHPQKRQVRFRDPRAVARAVRRCVEEALADPANNEPPARVYRIERSNAESEGEQDRQQRIQAATRRFWSAQLKPGRAAGDAAAAYLPSPSTERGELGDFGRLRVLGQALGRYLVCEGPDTLLLLNVDAARVRLTLEYLKRELAARGQVPAQRLLIPAMAELSSQEGALIEAHSELIAQLGVEVEPFGEGTWAIRGVPQPLQTVDPEALLRGLLEALTSVSDRQRDGQLERLLLQLAARGAAGAEQGEDEVRAARLLQALDEAGLSIARDVTAANVVRASGRAADEQRVAFELPLETIERYFDPTLKGKLG